MITSALLMNVIIVSFMGGILCLDRVVLQSAIARPVVAASAVGWFLGDVYTGLVSGAFVELFWIDRLPLGIYLPPNETVVAILIAAGSILTSHFVHTLPPALIALAVLIFIPLGIVAQKLEGWLCAKNGAVFQAAMADIDEGGCVSFSRKHLLAILRYCLVAVGLILVSLPVGIALLTWGYPRLPGFATRGLTLLYGILPFIGCAAALQTITVRGAVPVFCAVFLAVSVGIAMVRGG